MGPSVIALTWFSLHWCVRGRWVGLHLWSSGAQDVCNQSVTDHLRGSVGDQNAERNVEGRSLGNEVSEGIKGLIRS